MKPKKTSYYIINSITMYRLVSAPFLLILAILGHVTLFKWFMAVSFFTDAIDGPLSRKYNASSVFGSQLDSVADDATVLASTLSLWIIYPQFFVQHWIIISGLLALFAIQTIAALIAYGRVSSFHTYMAKTAAVCQAAFFFTIFFNLPIAQVAFYTAAIVTALQLVEEILLVIILSEWKTNVKGLYWILRSKKLIVHHNK
jgi:phosphatidylglycerophosphate synthase